MASGSAYRNLSGAFGLEPDPAFPAPSGLIEPVSACIAAFLSFASVSSRATSKARMPISQLTGLTLSGSIRRAKLAFSNRETAAWT